MNPRTARVKEQIVKLLTALGDGARLELLFLLGRHARLNVTDIASHFRLSRPTISHHLKILKDAGVVGREQIGQEVFYWLDREQVVANLHGFADVIAACDQREPT